MKATLSRDGLMRVDLRISCRLGLPELALALAASQSWMDEDDELPPRLSRTAIVTSVKAYLLNRGRDSLDGWADEMDEDRRSAIQSWATSTVTTAFPELKKEEP
ncbi:hypothetical protein ACIBCB_18185 [Streptomyces uncialis]|uniref:hypothetical protein n=1 Tax=Streptomyces uncialis TaxID=1048205 RepID=UPI003795EE57